MHNVTNISRGPRFVYVDGSPALIEAGATLSFALTTAEIESVQQQVDAGVLAWASDAPKAKAGGGSDENPVEVVTAAGLLGKVDTMQWLSFRAAATKLLGEGAPTTKVELLAALDERAKVDAAATGDQA